MQSADAFRIEVPEAAAVEHRSVPPRVAVVAPSLEILGGQGVQAMALMAHLRSTGYPVSFVPVNPRFPTGLGWCRRLPLVRTALNEALYVPSLKRLRDADVVHAYSASYWSFLLAPVPAMLAARRYGKRVILNYHSGEAEDHLSNWGRLVHPMLRLADEIVVPSPYLQQVFARHGYHSRVIRNVVDIDAFAFCEREPLRPQWLSVRGFQKHYRVDVVLRAFALFRESHPDATLVVAGYGPEEGRLKALADTLGTKGISFVGRIEPDDVPALFARADIFVNAAEIDNQPVSVLEAFAAGLPVVSTGVGDITTMLRGGAAGAIVPCGNPAALAAAVRELFNDPGRTRRLVANAREEVRRYTWSGIGARWDAVYRGLPG